MFLEGGAAANLGLGEGYSTVLCFSPIIHSCMHVRLHKQRKIPVLPITVSHCIYCGGEIAREPLTNDRSSSNECILGADDPSSTLQWLQFQTPIISWGNEHPMLQAPHHHPVTIHQSAVWLNSPHHIAAHSCFNLNITWSVVLFHICIYLM